MAKADKLHKVSSDREYLTVEELKQMADVYTGSPQTILLLHRSQAW